MDGFPAIGRVESRGFVGHFGTAKARGWRSRRRTDGALPRLWVGAAQRNEGASDADAGAAPAADRGRGERARVRAV